MRVAEALEKVRARYFVGGSVASSIDGEPRATNDIDFVIDMAVGKVRESRRCGKLRRVTFLRSLSFFVSCTLASAIMCACTTTDPGSFAGSYADALCARAVQCCPADDLAAFYQGSEASCRQNMSSRLSGGPGLVQYGIMRFDASAAEQCLKRIQSAACGALFAAPADPTDPCVSVFVGATANGGVCDGDFFCESGYCSGQICGVPPCQATTCPAGQYCLGEDSACMPVVSSGSVCTDDVMCGATGACLNNVCGASLADGSSCVRDEDCSSGVCFRPTATQPTGTCRPRFCQGV